MMERWIISLSKQEWWRKPSKLPLPKAPRSKMVEFTKMEYLYYCVNSILWMRSTFCICKINIDQIIYMAFKFVVKALCSQRKITWTITFVTSYLHLWWMDNPTRTQQAIAIMGFYLGIEIDDYFLLCVCDQGPHT